MKNLLIVLFVLIGFVSQAQKKGDKDVNLTIRDTLETQAMFVYQDSIIPMLDVSYHEYSTDGSTWSKDTTGATYVRFSNDLKNTWYEIPLAAFNVLWTEDNGVLEPNNDLLVTIDSMLMGEYINSPLYLQDGDTLSSTNLYNGGTTSGYMLVASGDTAIWQPAPSGSSGSYGKNVGIAGIGTYQDTIGAEMQFRNIAGSTFIDVALADSTIYLSWDGTSRSIIAGVGLSDGGDLGSDVTINIYILGLSEMPSAVDISADWLVMVDATSGTHYKVHPEDVLDLDLTTYVQNNGTATDNYIPRFDGATGKLIQTSSLFYVDDTNNLFLGGAFNNNGIWQIISGAPLVDIKVYSGTNGDVMLHSQGTGELGAYSGIAGTKYFAASTTLFNSYNLRGTGERLVSANADGDMSATITNNSLDWNTAYDNMIVSQAFSGTTTKTLTSTQQDGGTITADFNDLDEQDLSIDSTATTYSIGIENGNTVSFFKNTGSGAGSTLHDGVVTDRNINITVPSYTPSENDYLKILPDNSIPEGDTITLSVNSGTEYNILGYTSHYDTLAISVVYLNGYWGLYSREDESHLVAGINTGDQDIDGTDGSIVKYGTEGLTESIISESDSKISLETGTSVNEFSTDVTLSGGSDDVLVTENAIKTYVDNSISGINTNNGTQALTGTTPTMNVAYGKQATLTLTGATTLTIEGLQDGDEGSILITNGGSTSYRITFAGYTYYIYPSVWYSSEVVAVSGSTNLDVFTYKYVGGVVVINGALGLK